MQLLDIPFESLLQTINYKPIYNQLGLKETVKKGIESNDAKTIELLRYVNEVETQIIENKWIQPRGVYQQYTVQVTDKKLVLTDPSIQFDFPRLQNGDCVTDYCGKEVALFVVTCGIGVDQIASRLKESGQYLDSITLQLFALCGAEACAEHVHQQVRKQWGQSAKKEPFRVSLGYPLCPNLEDQLKIWQLLAPDKNIGVQLTENFMMSPEASVSGLILN